MNRKQKIIVSITGIFIILLALVGLTYAYFLTRITGNENDKSISVTTANLELVYGDGNGVLKPAEAIIPGKPIKFLDSDNNVVTEKTFTITNNGEDTDYVVVIDGDNNRDNGITPISVTYAENSGTQVKGASTSFVSNDFRYTITCTVDGESCNGITNEVFPMNGGIAVGNAIEKGKVHEYTLTMKYLETNQNQSDDMNKTFSAVINIEDIRRINPYSDNTDSLAYNIISNSATGSSNTKLEPAPLTKVEEGNIQLPSTANSGIVKEIMVEYPDCYGDTPEEALSCIERVDNPSENCENTYLNKYVTITGDDTARYVTKCDVGQSFYYETRLESSLPITTDDYGTSYYYRGVTEDNYMNFAGMCWRVVRIAGDGSTKLILEDQYAECDDTTENDKGTDGIVYTGNWNIGSGNYGYDAYARGSLTALDGSTNSDTVSIPNYLSNRSGTMAAKFKEFQSNFSDTELDEMKPGGWCISEQTYARTGTEGNYSYNLLSEIEKKDYYIKNKQTFYDTYIRLNSSNEKKVTMKCNGKLLETWNDNTPMYVGTLTYDEVYFAGIPNNLSSFLGKNSIWATLSLGTFEGYEFTSIYSSYGVTEYIYDNISLRPVINLAENTPITGTGTKADPYVVE